MARNGTKTGGRKKGSKNKRTLAVDAAKGGKLPLDYMLEVMRDRPQSSFAVMIWHEPLRLICMRDGHQRISRGKRCQL